MLYLFNIMYLTNWRKNAENPRFFLGYRRYSGHIVCHWLIINLDFWSSNLC